MDLNTLWFTLIVVLFAGFFLLEGFDYGVGILLPFLGKEDGERRALINTIGPFWDANETWMVTAGGAIFAAFPNWYATLFSGFYLALVLMLLALIVRGVGFEFRSKDERPAWRALWDKMIFIGSAVPALLWGVALANVLRGVPIDGRMNYTGSFFDLLNPYALIGGVASLALFTLHGALFLVLRTEGELAERARKAATRLGPITVLLLGLVWIGTYVATDFAAHSGVVPGSVPFTGAAAILLAGWFVRRRLDGWAFAATGITIITAVITIFTTLFPRVMVSSLNPGWSLTIYNASSSHYTLTVMSIVALLFVPVMLGYQIWTYWVFRQRVAPAKAQ
jgi:cytochrome d ubiquinol oxidase subunit II